MDGNVGPIIIGAGQAGLAGRCLRDRERRIWCSSAAGSRTLRSERWDSFTC